MLVSFDASLIYASLIKVSQIYDSLRYASLIETSTTDASLISSRMKYSLSGASHKCY